MRTHIKGSVPVILLIALAGCKTINVEDAVNGAVAGALGAMNSGNPTSTTPVTPNSGGAQTTTPQPARLPTASPTTPAASNVDTSKIKTVGAIKPQGTDKNPRSLTQISIDNCYQRESGGVLGCDKVAVLSKLTPEGWVSETKSFYVRRGSSEVLNSGTYLLEYSESEMNVKNIVTLQSGVTNKFSLFLD